MANGPVRSSLALLGLALFVAILSARDLLARYAFMHETSLFQLLFVAGVVALSLSVVLACSAPPGTHLRPKRWGRQIVRLFANATAWALAMASAQFLRPSSIAVIGKANGPILVLLAPIVGVTYARRQYLLSTLAILGVAVFMLFGHQEGETLTGYLLALVTVTVVACEYLLLRQTVFAEHPFVVVATPALACLSVGLAGCWVQSLPLWSSSLPWTALIAFGVVVFLFYFMSIHRYKLLPLGWSEMPALLSGFCVLGADILFFQAPPNLFVLASLSFVSICLYLSFKDRLRLQNV